MRLRWLAATAGLAALSLSARAADWTMDAASSRLEFFPTVENVVAPGVFRAFDAQLKFDPDRPIGGTLDVTIIVKSADMNSADLNKGIAGADWFDFARFPRAEFHAGDITRIGEGRYLARGLLTVKGVQQPVSVPFTWAETGATARMDGEFVVQRGAFGIGTGQWAAPGVIGADVKLKFSVGMRQRG